MCRQYTDYPSVFKIETTEGDPLWKTRFSETE